MTLAGKHALITGSSRGIGKGIALKLAKEGAKVAINYFKNKSAADDTLTEVRELGSDGITVQSDISDRDTILKMFDIVANEFGSLDIFISNALIDLNSIFQLPLEVTPDKCDIIYKSQPEAFLIGCQQSDKLMNDNGRIIAISYSPGVNTGGWQPYVV